LGMALWVGKAGIKLAGKQQMKLPRHENHASNPG